MPMMKTLKKSAQLRLRSRARASRAAGKKRVDPSPFNWLHHLDTMLPAEFKAHYRLSRDAFEDLLAMLLPMLAAADKKQAARSRRGELRRVVSHAFKNLSRVVL